MSSKRRLHPLEISRESGLHTLDALKVLNTTPEMFLKVPGNSSGGTSLYALRPSIVAQSSESVVAYIDRLALRDRILYYGFVTLLLAVLLVAALRSITFIRYLFAPETIS